MNLKKYQTDAIAKLLVRSKELLGSGTNRKIIFQAPTGSGKTLLARSVAKYLNVPFVVADATSLTEAGYVGEDVENLLLRLLKAADFDIAKAQRGIEPARA